MSGETARLRSDRAYPLPTASWRARPGRGRAAAAAEQDRAAGGQHRRLVSLKSGEVARATIELRPSARRGEVRAHLRWTEDGRGAGVALGPVTERTRAANLREGWRVARERGLLAPDLPEGSWASTPGVRASMRGNRGRDTGPELRLRSLLHARGLRYRVSTRPLAELRRTADVVFPKARVAVFVDGCYWHGCPEHHRPATRNSEFWRQKIAENRRRDEETTRCLNEAGWTVVRSWEHEEPENVVTRILTALEHANGTSRAGLEP